MKKKASRQAERAIAQGDTWPERRRGLQSPLRTPRRVAASSGRRKPRGLGSPGRHEGAGQASIVADPDATRHRDHAPVKRPGAQPGNRNAVKHGFYSAIFKANERRLLAEMPLTDLSAEIELIRVTNKRFLQALAASKGELDFESQLTALRAINLSAHSITTLLRAHAITTLVNRELDEALPHPAADPPDDAPPSGS